MTDVLAGAVAVLRLRKAREAFEAGKPDVALVEAEELLDAHPDDVDALLVVGDACLELGDAMGARAALSQALARRPMDLGGLVGLAVAHFELTDFSGAAQYARLALQQDDSQPEAWYYLGRCLERLDEAGAAIQALGRAAQLAPETFPLAESLTDAQWEQALEASLALLTPVLRRWFDAIRIESPDQPAVAELRAAQPPITPDVAALYVGDPPEDPVDPWVVRPRGIRLFRGNLLRVAAVHGDLPRCIAEALRGEALAWLGLAVDAHPLGE